jgi:hypothetical protein
LVLFSSRPWVRKNGVFLPRAPAIRSRDFQYGESWFGSCWSAVLKAGQPGRVRSFIDASWYASVSAAVPGLAAIAL